MKKIYCFFIILSIFLIIISISLLNNTKILASIIIVISIYLLLGSIIKICKNNDKLKNKMISTLDLLFWLP